MFEKFDPPLGGLERLRTKIDMSERQTRLEFRVMSVAASVLLIVLLGVRYASRFDRTFDLETPSPVSKIEVPTGMPGVRFLWLSENVPSSRHIKTGFL